MELQDGVIIDGTAVYEVDTNCKQQMNQETQNTVQKQDYSDLLWLLMLFL